MKPFRTCLRALLRTLKPIRFKVGVSVLFGLAEVALALLFVWYSKRLVDIATGQDAGGLTRGIIVFVSILLAQIAVRVAARSRQGYDYPAEIRSFMSELRKVTRFHLQRDLLCPVKFLYLRYIHHSCSEVLMRLRRMYACRSSM